MFSGVGVPGLIARQGKQPLPKLLNRNFFLLVQAQTVSVFGNQAYTVAMVFWIKRTTNSASLIGMLGMMSGLLMALLGPLGGAVADRHPRRKLLVASDTLNGIAVAAVAALMLLSPDSTHAILGAIILAAVLSAVTGSYFQPAISASVPDLVPRDRVPAAASTLQSAFQMATLVGRGVAGLLYQLMGAPVMFLMDALTYWFAAATESFIQMPPQAPRRKGMAGFERDTVAGFRYVWDRPGLRATVLGSSLLNFFSAPIMVLFPFFVEDFLKVGPGWYGYLLAAHGGGSLIGFALAGALRLGGRSRSRWILAGMLAQAVGFGALGFVRNPVLALGLSLADGVLVGFVGVSIIAILQVTTPSEFRGRVFGLVRSLAGAISPLGMGLAGVAADLLGKNIPLIYAFCGGMMTLTALWLMGNRNMRDFLRQEAGAAPAPGSLEAIA